MTTASDDCWYEVTPAGALVSIPMSRAELHEWLTTWLAGSYATTVLIVRKENHVQTR